MKKHLCSIIILLFSFILSAQNNITLSSDQHMIYLGAIDKTTPVYIIRKDTEGLISTIKEYYYYIGEEKTGPYDKCGWPVFSPDGKTLAYTAKIDGKNYVIAGKEKVGPYNWCYDLTFSPDGKTLAYTAEIDGKLYVIAGKEKAGPYNWCCFLTFSPDGKTLAYQAIIDCEWYVIAGKEKAGPYNWCVDLTFSPDGKTLAYRAEIDGELQSMLLFEGNEYIGSICNNSIIYFSNNQIF